MPAELTRRIFLQTSVLTTAIGVAPHATLLGANPPSTNPYGFRDPVRIKKIYLAKPVPTWPTPHLDLEKEMQKLDDVLEDVQKELPEIVFEGGELLRVAGDAPKVKESLSQVDGVLLFNLTSGVGALIEAITGYGKPTLLFSQPYSGHDWSLIADMQKKGLKIDVIASSEYHDLVGGMRAFRTVKRLAQSKILALRKAGTDDSKEIQRFGTRIVPLQAARLMEAYERVEEKEAAKDAQRWISGAVKVVEPSRDEVQKSSRLYLAMKKVMEEESAQAITINCLGLFAEKQLPAYPCLGFSRLNSSGCVGACEADVESTLTMLMFQYLTGKPGFISDPVVDTATNTVIHAHCVAPLQMDGLDGPEEPYILRSHMEDDKGAALQVKLRIGRAITMAKLVGTETLLLSVGKIVDTPDVERGCRTKITTQVADARKLLRQYSHGLHRVIFYGDHTPEVERLGKYLGFNVVYEM